MLLGKIFGKVTTSEFKFLVEGEARKFEYVQVYHQFYEYVLCQIVELEKQEDMTTALCQIIGYKDKEGKIKKLRIPFEPGTEVLSAEDDFVASVIQLEDTDSGAYVGKLDGKDIDVFIDLKKLLTKHVAILAKSGSGKSYTVGVLLEEIIEKKVPLLIIDPHGEYSTMKFENDHEDEVRKMAEFHIKPKKFQINEYGDTTINPQVRPLRISNKLSSKELVDMLPVKLTSSQLGTLYSATQNLNDCDFESVLYNLNLEEGNAKWNLMGVIEQLRDIGLFSNTPTPYHELVKSGQASILNFRGINPEIQDIIVYKLTKDLFELRKQNKIPPFFLVVEEAHNYCPERSFGEKKSSKILRTIASEGRKFGLGLCVVSQRPARVDKSVISQCSTQIIMKVTNPNDLKAISSSVEGITSTTEREIQDISVGTSLITGITDVPLFVRIRPRKSRHGGHAVDMLNSSDYQVDVPQKDLMEQVTEFEEQDMLPLIKPVTTAKDVALMSDEPAKGVDVVLVPIYQVTCKDDEQFKLLIDATSGAVIVDKETNEQKFLPELESLSKKELQILQAAFTLKSFKTVDLIKTLGSNLDVSKEIEVLCAKRYILKEDDTYHLGTDFIFNRLSNYKSFDEISYESLGYVHKKEDAYDIDVIMHMLGKFTSVVDHTKAYLVTYVVRT
ncbi:MAG: ATP-binding protein [Nanoarchaeota archaeon]|nr:ATP-binding protein [Nanoarchaeota archaeon]